MTTPAEYLRDRIKEVEALMLAVPDGDPALGDGRDDRWQHEFGWEGFNGTEEPWLSAVLAVKPSRVLAECEAKRRIVDECQAAIAAGEVKPGTTWNDDAAGAELAKGILSLLALPYADRADFPEELKL